MTAPLLFALPGNEAMAPCLAAALGAELGEMELRRFPDGESYVRLDSEVSDRDVILLATLARPDPLALPLIFAANAARDEGAASVGLVAPYLAYMRQDRRFKPGEAVSSRHFAGLISGAVDWLVTVDPHLHRHGSLNDIYSIPTRAVSAAPLMSDWIARNVRAPVLIGPDAESEQWVSTVAKRAGRAGRVPYTVLAKTRHGDREVTMSVPDKAILKDRTPVLVDDIISTAGTMAEAARTLQALGAPPPVCMAVHAVFAGHATDLLKKAGVTRIVTTNSIAHESNTVDICHLIAKGAADLMK